MSDIEHRIADFLRAEADAIALSDRTYERVLRRAKVRRVVTAAVAGVAVVIVGIAGVVAATTLRDPSGIRPAAPAESPAPSATPRETGNCPVTVPPQPGLVPPEPYPPEPPLLPEPFRDVWYGTPELWTTLDHNGAVWRDLPLAEDGHVGDKTLWFSENFSTAEGEDFSGDANITVTAVHLDGSARTVVEEGGVPSFNRDIKNFILVGLELPEPGCWEVTARYQGAEVSYVLYVEDHV